MPRRLPVEPLDKSRWDRIERELASRLERGEIVRAAPERAVVRWPLWAAAALVAVAAIFFFGWYRSPRTPQQVATVAAVTRVETEGAPSRLEVGSSTVEIAAHSSVRIEGNDESGVTVSLERGAVECEVAPRHDRPPFIVRAGDATVRVVGTHFRVEREERITRVAVERGAVEVVSHGETTIVRAGSSWPAPAQTAAIEPMPIATTSAAVPPVVKSSATTVAPVVTASPSPRERYNRALAIEATSPDEALAIYAELATGDGPWAMNALFESGRFQLERGNKEVARARFEEYLRRYPTGPNAHDASDHLGKLR